MDLRESKQWSPNHIKSSDKRASYIERKIQTMVLKLLLVMQQKCTLHLIYIK